MATEQNQATPKKSKGKWLRVLLVYVIGLGLILLVPGYFVNHYFTYNSYLFEQGYEKFGNHEVSFETEAGVKIPTPESEPDKTAWLAYAAYEQGEYATAISHLNLLLKTQPKNSGAYLYIGLCHLELRECPQAIEAFNQVLALKNPHYSDDAEWYLALTYLLENNKSEYNARFVAISASESDYRTKAKEILDRLD